MSTFDRTANEKEEENKTRRKNEISTVIVCTEAVVVCTTYKEQLQLPSCSKIVIARVA